MMGMGFVGWACVMISMGVDYGVEVSSLSSLVVNQCFESVLFFSYEVLNVESSQIVCVFFGGKTPPKQDDSCVSS